jgi:hypothetical protein
MACKTQGWFQRWGCLRPSDAAASPGRGAAPDGAGSGAGAETPACPPALAASSDAGASDLITGGDCDDQPTSPTVDLETLPPEGRVKRTRHPRFQDFSPLLSQEGIFTLKISMIPYPKLCVVCHLTLQVTVAWL